MSISKAVSKLPRWAVSDRQRLSAQPPLVNFGKSGIWIKALNPVSYNDKTYRC